MTLVTLPKRSLIPETDLTVEDLLLIVSDKTENPRDILDKLYAKYPNADRSIFCGLGLVQSTIEIINERIVNASK